jgi:CubicO group peptidase (beta-lactamase class C family)
VAELALGSSEPGRCAAGTDVARLYCVAKPLTTVCVAQAVERGTLDWDDPVSRFLPVRADDEHRRLTLRSLLTHSSGLPSLPASVEETSFDEVVAKATTAEIPAWAWSPDPRYNLTLAWHVLAAVLEAVEGVPVDSLIRRDVGGPLGLPGLCLADPPHPERYAASYKYAAPHQFEPVDPVPPAGLFSRVNPAHGGVATAGDVGGFWQELLRCFRGRGSLLTVDTVAELIRPRATVSMGPLLRPAGWGTGLEVGLAAHAMKGDWSPRTFGHRGALPPRTVLLAFVDPDRDVVGVVRLFSVDPRTNWRIWKATAGLSADLHALGC